MQAEHLIWIVFGLLALAGWRLMRSDRRRIARVFDTLARSRGGSIKGVFASYPQLRLRHGAADVLVSAIHGANGPFTFASCDTSEFPDSCCFSIRGNALPTRIMQWDTRLQKITTGRAEFDRAFSVYARDPVVAGSLLTPQVQGRLIDLDAGRGLEVRYEEHTTTNRFLVSIESILTREAEYAELIDATMMLLDELGRIAPDHSDAGPGPGDPGPVSR